MRERTNKKRREKNLSKNKNLQKKNVLRDFREFFVVYRSTKLVWSSDIPDGPNIVLEANTSTYFSRNCHKCFIYDTRPKNRNEIRYGNCFWKKQFFDFPP